MRGMLTTTRIFALFLLTALTGGALSKPASNATPSDGDVHVTITTYDGNGASRSVTAIVPSSGLATRDVSSAGSTPVQTTAAGGDLVISQIYSNGGNTGSTYQNNYLELFNRTSSPIDFSGWKIYLASLMLPVRLIQLSRLPARTGY